MAESLKDEPKDILDLIAAYFNRDTKNLHFVILNLFLKIRQKINEYCSCDKYSGCANYFTIYGRNRHYCALCRILFDLCNTKKECYDSQFDLDELLEIADRFLPYLKECFNVIGDDDSFVELFNGVKYSRTEVIERGETPEENIVVNLTLWDDIERYLFRKRYLEIFRDFC